MYDIDKSIFGSPPYTITAGPGFSMQVQEFGVDPSGLLPLDFSHSTNVTFRFAGPLTEQSTVFAGFSILTSIGNSSQNVEYASQRTLNRGLGANRKISEIGHVEVPWNIPEPSALVLLILACLGVIAMHFTCRPRAGKA